MDKLLSRLERSQWLCNLLHIIAGGCIGVAGCCPSAQNYHLIAGVIAFVIGSLVGIKAFLQFRSDMLDVLLLERIKGQDEAE